MVIYEEHIPHLQDYMGPLDALGRIRGGLGED